MPLYVNDKSDYEPIPEGMHVAVCSGCVDLGLQPGSLTEQKPKRQLLLRFEFPDIQVATNEDDTPRDKWVFYSHSL